ncbi:AraC family transcriptional regulator [Maribacter confluentis]|uniref:AraC family transcriptional regulator n=1 Tax=Maribacter confluentis TaxID=1656093 RepID=A0ABT8RPJ7_9FLAO|nr:AraC family transcriptional regulator [Maribacter confluentis]MDO1512799.1 AraC family transcriptional regulator [Maribacter confluentis]
MNELTICSSNDFFSQLLYFFNGDLTEAWGERQFDFSNDLGHGAVRTIGFDWGITLLDLDITLHKDIKIVFNQCHTPFIDFIFISQGCLKYSKDNSGELISLEQFQNIIFSPIGSSHPAFIYPKDQKLKINLIKVLPAEYQKKKHNNLTYLNESLMPLFTCSKETQPYLHLGNFSLQLADEIKQLSNIPDYGILRTLALEGRLYMILSMQLVEHHNFTENMNMPEAISKNEIIKIHRLTEYIIEHLADNTTITTLSSVSGLSPKKLQLGFKILYSKTVNEYIRQLKLEISRDYLKNTDLSVSEIVYAIGIKSRSYFSKIFFEAYEILPTEYRKQLKNKNTSLN